MSTRSSICLGESEGKTVHIYWELADRETNGNLLKAPVYLAVDAGNADEEVAIRLPRDLALRLLTIADLVRVFALLVTAGRARAP